MKKTHTPGELLRTDLTAAGWTQREFAGWVNMEESDLSRLLNDKLPLSLRRAVRLFRDIAFYTDRPVREYLIAMVDLMIEKETRE